MEEYVGLFVKKRRGEKEAYKYVRGTVKHVYNAAVRVLDEGTREEEEQLKKRTAARQQFSQLPALRNG